MCRLHTASVRCTANDANACTTMANQTGKHTGGSHKGKRNTYIEMKTVINEAYRKYADYIANLPSRFDSEGTMLYKGRNTVKRYDAPDGSKWVVKRYKKPSLPQAFIYTFVRKGKAERAFRNAAMFRQRGVSTPHEIAYIEEKDNGLMAYSYYICENTDAHPIAEKLEADDFDHSLADAFARFVARMHVSGAMHKDLNPTNVLYETTADGYEFSVIDINRASFTADGSPCPTANCLNNLTLFTGRMPLFRYVARRYAESRGWPDSMIQAAVDCKIKHDKRWRRRKDFLKKFKKK